MKKFPIIVQGVKYEDYACDADVIKLEEDLQAASVKEIYDDKMEDLTNDLEILDNISDITDNTGISDMSDIPVLSVISDMYTRDENEYTQYDEIPQYYYNPKSWIKVTNLNCWTCGNKVVNIPFFVPLSWKKHVVKMDDKYITSQKLNVYNSAIDNKEERVMKVHGIMCNERCAARYINRHYDESITDKWASMRMLEVLTSQIYGRNTISEIQEAPDKSLMMHFSGPHGLTVKQFRELNNNLF